MTNKFLLLFVFIILVAGLFFWLNNYIYEEKQATYVSDYKDGEYIIEGRRIQLNDGASEIEIAPGSASKIVTEYFGNEVRGDFNADGREDIAFLLTQTSGGSGSFYYAVVALNSEKGYLGTNAILLGDRIAPQTTEFRDGRIIVNYATRREDEPMTARPSMGVSKYLKIEAETLVQAQNQQ